MTNAEDSPLRGPASLTSTPSLCSNPHLMQAITYRTVAVAASITRDAWAVHGGRSRRGGPVCLDESCLSCCLADLGTSRGRLASIFRSPPPPPHFPDHPGTGVVVGSVGSVSERVRGVDARLTCPTALAGDQYELCCLWCVVEGGRRCCHGTKATTTTTTVAGRPPGSRDQDFVCGLCAACVIALCM